jgi:hypothetical protein
MGFRLIALLFLSSFPLFKAVDHAGCRFRDLPYGLDFDGLSQGLGGKEPVERIEDVQLGGPNLMVH